MWSSRNTNGRQVIAYITKIYINISKKILIEKLIFIDFYSNVFNKFIDRVDRREYEFKRLCSINRNYPKEGIIFRDITPLMNNGEAYKYATEKIVEFAKNHDIDIVVGPEARGFIFGCPVSYALGVGFVPVRKPGKLPREVVEYAYDLEYGSNKLCLHKDAIKPGQKVLVVDDLLATGGTVEATIKLVEELGGVVAGLAFLIELVDLKGRDKLNNYPIITLMQY